MSGTTATTDTKALEALLSALNKSAERMQTLWFSFIGLTLYFLITALTTTHMNLLLDEAQVLPIIAMKVPLLPFYVIAPIFYVVIHFYVLLMLVLLARSAKVFEDDLHRSIRLESERETFRMRLENTLFLQLLVGAKPERAGMNGWLLSTMALITIAVAPIATLLVIQLQFLPYHHFEITWLHRAMVGVDLALVFLLWRGYRRRWGRPLPVGPIAAWKARGRWWAISGPAAVVAWTLGSGATSWLTLFEGRWHGEPEAGWAGSDRWKSGWIVGEATAFRDRLNVHGESIVGAELFERAEKERKSRGGGSEYVRTRDFRGRDFTGADFGEADLRRADFRGETTVLREASFGGAYLQGGRLDLAQMQGARFDIAQMQGANFFKAQMEGASFQRTQMQGTRFDGAQMQGASFNWAQMPGTRFDGAQMRKASFIRAQMQGASFRAVRMQCAIFAVAQMQGANFDTAQMEGASFFEADIQGASFDNAQMSGANLFEAQMQGAIFSDARMRGTIFFAAQMQGASFVGAEMQAAVLAAANMSDADLDGVFVWRSATSELVTEGAFIGETHADRVKIGDYRNPVPLLTDADVDELSADATFYVVDAKQRDAIVARFEPLRGENADLDAAVATFWADQEKTSSKRFPDRATFDAHTASVLGDLACDASDRFRSARPHLARGVMRFRLDRLDLASRATVRSRLLAGRKDLAACPGVEGFTDADWTELGKIKPLK